MLIIACLRALGLLGNLLVAGLHSGDKLARSCPGKFGVNHSAMPPRHAAQVLHSDARSLQQLLIRQRAEVKPSQTSVSCTTHDISTFYRKPAEYGILRVMSDMYEDEATSTR